MNRRAATVGRHVLVQLLLIGLAVGLVAGWQWTSRAGETKPYAVPQSGELENRLGVRFTRAALLADGGIIEVRYVVLDPEKASRFQADDKHPPVLRSERRNARTARTAAMRPGHALRPGQTYFLLYQNTRGAVRPGETMTIDAGGHRLLHVPVR